MGSVGSRETGPSARRTLAVFLMLALLVVTVPALATVYDFIYAGATGTVQTPTVTLGAGSAGSSLVSSVAADAATATVTAGLTFYESAAAQVATLARDGSASGSSITSTLSTPSTTTSAAASSTDAQRKSFYCLGRYWVFYSDGTNEVYRSSTDGSTWSAATTVTAGTSGTYLATWADCANSKLYYAFANGGTTVTEDRGTLSSGGTVTWDYAARSFTPAELQPSDPAVALDSSGNEFIAIDSVHGGKPAVKGNHIEVWECANAASTTGTCTWSSTQDLLVNADSAGIDSLYPALVSVGSAELGLVYNTAAGTASGPVGIQTWSGSAWSTEVTTTSSYNILEYSVTAIGSTVHFAGVTSAGTVVYWSCAYPCGSAPTESTLSSATTNSNAVIESDGSTELVVAYGGSGASTTLSYVMSDSSGATWSAAAVLAASDSVNAGGVLSGSYSEGNNAYQFVWTSAGSSPYNLRSAVLVTRNAASAVLITASANDVVYVTVAISNGGSQTVTGVTDSKGLTYAQRGSATDGTAVRVETWYAIAASALTSPGDTITVTVTSATHFTVVAMGISGANTVTPFDPSLSSPVTATGTGTPATASVSTTFPNDYLIGAVGVGAPPALSAGAGFSSVSSPFAGGNVASMVEGQTVTSPQSSTPASVSWTGATQGWAMVADAIVAGKPSITVDTSTSAPGTSGSTTLSRGSSILLWSPPFTAGSALYQGSWVADVWAAGASAGTLTVSAFAVTSSGGLGPELVSSASTNSISTSETEVKTTVSGAAGSVASNGAILLVLTAPSGGPATFTVYWGTGQTSNFETPSTYNYVLSIVNGGGTAWNVNLATTSSQVSNAGRLSATLSFVSPASNQIVMSLGTLTQASGSVASLAGSATIAIQVAATANAIPTASSVPSTITFSVRVASTTSTAYAQYTVVLTVN